MHAARTLLRLLPAVSFLVSFAIGLDLLYRAHPHEDAFILFEYVQHLAAGEGIVFWRGGPRAEGATDFLWLLLLAGAVRLGADVAVAACVLNAFGAAIATRIFLAALARFEVDLPTTLVLAAAALAAISTSSAAVAGYVGFGSMLQSALILKLLTMLVDGRPVDLARLPWVALAVALLRSDGAVLALGAIAIALVHAHRAGTSGRTLRQVAVVAVCAAAYFGWRWRYFGLPLPLPLYVKSHGALPLGSARTLDDLRAAMLGFDASLQWLTGRLGPLPYVPAALLSAGLLLCARSDAPVNSARARVRRFVPALLLACAFAGLFAFGRHVQNYAYRYQGAVTLFFAYASFELVLLALTVKPRSAAVRAMLVGLWLACAAPGVQRGLQGISKWHAAHSYVDIYPACVGRLLSPDRRIALTEAGRLAYWTDVRTEDFVGLNSPRTALTPPDRAWTTAVDPDIVLLHTFNAFSLPLGHATPETQVVEIEPRALREALVERFAALWEHDLTGWPIGLVPESIAPVVLARHLVESGTHRIFAVRYYGLWNHVWGIRRGLPEEAALVAELRRSTEPGAWRSYADLAGLPFAARSK